MCEEPMADKNKINFLKEEIAKINPNAKIIKTIFRPQPLSSIKGKKVLMVMTARKEIETKIRKYMEKEYNCYIIGMTFNLSNREDLRKDLSKFSDYDTILTELKAASVDVVTDFAFKNNKDIIYLNNVPMILGDEAELEEGLANIYNKIKF
jgi:cyclic 2,3-diphosphoglycerate synthetase